MNTDDITEMGPLIARLNRLRERLMRADAERPWAVDVAVVGLVIALFCLPVMIKQQADALVSSGMAAAGHE